MEVELLKCIIVLEMNFFVDSFVMNDMAIFIVGFLSHLHLNEQLTFCVVWEQS